MVAGTPSCSRQSNWIGEAENFAGFESPELVVLRLRAIGFLRHGMSRSFARYRITIAFSALKVC